MMRPSSLAANRVRVLLTVIVAASALVSGAAAAGASPDSCKAPARAPLNPGKDNNVLDGIAMTSNCDAWVVGSYTTAAHHSFPLIEHWNGARWSVPPMPNLGTGLITGAAAVSPGDAWAVGRADDKAVIEHWNGNAWQYVTGAYTRRGATLTAVSAASPTDVWAVGYYRSAAYAGLPRPLIEHWNGSTWQRFASAGTTTLLDNELDGVTALSRHNAWAVGYGSGPAVARTFIEHWNGTSWRRVASPNVGQFSYLTAVTGSSARDLWAVGSGANKTVPLIERWDGVKWRRVPSASAGPRAAFQLTGVAASATRVWAVGWFLNNQGGQVTLVERWNGTTWQRRPSPNPGGLVGADELQAVAVDQTGAVAAGSYAALKRLQIDTLVSHLQ
jgi:hypothetical protein